MTEKQTRLWLAKLTRNQRDPWVIEQQIIRLQREKAEKAAIRRNAKAMVANAAAKGWIKFPEQPKTQENNEQSV